MLKSSPAFVPRGFFLICFKKSLTCRMVSGPTLKNYYEIRTGTVFFLKTWFFFIFKKFKNCPGVSFLPPSLHTPPNVFCHRESQNKGRTFWGLCALFSWVRYWSVYFQVTLFWKIARKEETKKRRSFKIVPFLRKFPQV